MIKTYKLLFCLLFCAFAYSQSKFVSNEIISHRSVIIFNKQPEYHHKKIVLFPHESRNIRNVKLKIKLDCNGSCEDYNAIDRIVITPKKGNDSYEIARLILPKIRKYLPNSTFEWETDVTDFSDLLRREVDVDYYHKLLDKEEKSDASFKLTLMFTFIEGLPIANSVKVHKLYQSDYKFGDLADPIENYINTAEIIPMSSNSVIKIKTLHTVHGRDSQGCPELCDKNRKIIVDGRIIESKNLWSSCYKNSIIPQSGDWTQSRANWCYGSLIEPEEKDIKLLKRHKTIKVSFDLEKYELDALGFHAISSYIIEYDNINNDNDAAIIDIIKPSDKLLYSNKNPSSGKPVIKVKNNGKNKISHLKISYGIENSPRKVFDWVYGIINFGEVAEIELPDIVYTNSNKRFIPFYVEIIKVNNTQDDYLKDNIMESAYRTPKIIPDNFIVYYKTNNFPEDNDYTIEDHYGNIFFKKKGKTLEKKAAYYDTITLPKGNYKFIIKDFSGDGLRLDTNRDGGSGRIRFLDSLGRVIKNVEPNFGRELDFDFLIDEGYSFERSDEIDLFPRIAKDVVAMDFFFEIPEDFKVLIVDYEDELKVIERHQYAKVKEGTFYYDLTNIHKSDVFFIVYKAGQVIYKAHVHIDKPQDSSEK